MIKEETNHKASSHFIRDEEKHLPKTIDFLQKSKSVSVDAAEFNLSLAHKDVKKAVGVEEVMDKSSFDQINMQQDGIKICLLFPKNPEDDDRIKKEVKDILACALREHLQMNA